VFGTLVLFRDVSVEHLAKNARAEFVAHVAHELKTPLNVMAMYSEALQGEEGQDEGFRVEAYNVLHDEVERVSMLINNLLSITKIEMGSLEVVRQRVRPRDLLEDAFNAIARSGRAGGLSLNLDLPREMTPISVDKDLLRIAVNNLLTNAVKYNRPGGSVTLSAEETDDALRIRVRDTGIGIGADEKDKVFDKFYRSNDAEVRSRTGHGLGLSLTRDIIQLHHGRLSVDSTPGEGSEFTIELDKEAVLLGQAGNP
jgi:signal transduction histidine kinase